MYTIHREQLKKLALGLYGKWKRLQCNGGTSKSDIIKFDMSYWAHDEENEELPRPRYVESCGTSCCAFGHAVFYCNPPSSNEDWSSYRERLTGLKGGTNVDTFLFSSWWPDKIEQAIARIYWVLDDRQIPDMMDYNFETEYPIPNLKQLQEIVP